MESSLGLWGTEPASARLNKYEHPEVDLEIGFIKEFIERERDIYIYIHT